VLLVSVAALELYTSGAAQGGTVWDGVFSDAQAARGEVLYAEQCQTCQVLEGAAVAPVLVGRLFLENWDGSTMAELAEVISTTMPPAAPGNLSPEDIAATLAYMLSMSGAPAGEADLGPASLGGLVVQPAQ
jgi:mono/diheme cytochrome c family protein